MTIPEPFSIIRKALVDEASVASLLEDQPGVAEGVVPIFAYEYPGLYTPMLKNRALKLLLISPSGRAASGGDTSRALWGRPRFDLQCYAPTFAQAAALHWATYEFLKSLSRVRAELSTGVGLIHDCTVEGGPIEFNDPDTDCPVVVGIYAASMAEEFVIVA